VIVLDTSGLFAALNPDQPHHEGARRVLLEETAPLVISPYILAELDYLIATRGGVDRELRVLRELAGGAYTNAGLDSGELRAAADVIEQYCDLGIGLADASIVVLAGRFGTNRVLTLDEKHFRALRTTTGEPFVVLPADA
jgi:uncharacterized protein